MPALRLLGLVILAALACTIGILGYVYLRGTLDASAARDAANKVAIACQTVINSGGGTQVVEISLPGDYQMSFQDNQISVDGYRVPDGGLSLQFAETENLTPGTYRLSITTENNLLVVTRI